MKNLFIYCCFVLLFNSCITYDKCIQKFGQVVKSDTTIKYTHDTISMVGHDSIIIKHLPGETVVVRDSIPCPDLINKTIIGKSNKGTIKTEIDIKNNVITAKCDADSLIEIIHHRDSIITILQGKVTTITNQNKMVDTRKWWQKIPWYVPVLVILLLIIILLLILKKIFS